MIAQGSCGPTRGRQSALQWGSRRGGPQRAETFALLLNLRIHRGLMVVIPRQGGIDLGQRKVRMILLDGFSSPAVSQVIQGEFDDLDVGIVNPSAAPLIAMNMGPRFDRCCHGGTLQQPAGRGKTRVGGVTRGWPRSPKQTQNKALLADGDWDMPAADGTKRCDPKNLPTILRSTGASCLTART